MKNKKVFKIIVLSIICLVTIFAIYNLFFGDVTNEVYSFTEITSPLEATKKYKINNKDSFESFFKNSKKKQELEKYNLDEYTIFIKFKDIGGCNPTENNKVRVTNFVNIDGPDGLGTCASFVGTMTVVVIPNNLLWKTYTGNWKTIN